MTDRVRVTITGYYDLPDGPELRQRAYGSTSTGDCLAVDVRGNPADLISCCENVSMTLELDTGEVCACGEPRLHHLPDGTIKPTPWSDETCDGFTPAGGEEA